MPILFDDLLKFFDNVIAFVICFLFTLMESGDTVVLSSEMYSLDPFFKIKIQMEVFPGSFGDFVLSFVEQIQWILKNRLSYCLCDFIQSVVKFFIICLLNCSI